MVVMSPRKLVTKIRDDNQMIFEQFLDFPKPMVAAINGPAIGVCVTTATLMDDIIASPSASFMTPFASLGLVPEVRYLLFSGDLCFPCNLPRSM